MLLIAIITSVIVILIILKLYIIIIMIRNLTHRFHKLLCNRTQHTFANFVVNNPTTGKPCAQFEKLEGEAQMKKQDQAMEQGRRKWKDLSITGRKQKLGIFLQALQKNKEQIVSTILNSTGKHREYAELQFEASISVLKQDLSQNYPQTIHKKSGVYHFKSFGNILVVCDYRMVLLSCVKYLVSCGIAGNSLILNPHRYGLPIGKKLQQLWRATLPQYPLIYCPVNNFADGLEYQVQKKDMGFVSFTGDIEEGNKFYHFMAQKSQILAQSQFLLMSTDSAYVLKDLTDANLQKAASNLSMACFMAGGNLFNSVKRIFVDEEVSDKFTAYFIEASKQYKVSAQNSKISPIITANHITETKKQIKELSEFKGNELRLLTEFQTKQSYKSLYVSPIVYQVEGIPTIEYWNKIYTMPICFIQKVTSAQTVIEQINSSIYGISSTIYSTYKDKIYEIGKDLDVGVVNGNRWGFTPGVPYSPRKRSGKGHSFSVLSYTNVTKSQSLKGFYESVQ